MASALSFSLNSSASARVGRPTLRLLNGEAHRLSICVCVCTCLGHAVGVVCGDADATGDGVGVEVVELDDSISRLKNDALRQTV